MKIFFCCDVSFPFHLQLKAAGKTKSLHLMKFNLYIPHLRLYMFMLHTTECAVIDIYLYTTGSKSCLFKNFKFLSEPEVKNFIFVRLWNISVHLYFYFATPFDLFINPIKLK